MIAEHPWFGTGLGTFVWSFPSYRSTEVSLFGVWDRAHSTPLELIADLGIPLAVVTGLGWILILALLIRGATRRRRDRMVPLAALSVALICLLHSMVDFSLQVPGYAIVAFAVVGVGLAQSFRTSTNSIGITENKGSSQTRLCGFFPLASDVGPKDCRFRDDGHGLFDGSSSASKGTERGHVLSGVTNRGCRRDRRVRWDAGERWERRFRHE